jgi:uncharacterized iron-regulated protein
VTALVGSCAHDPIGDAPALPSGNERAAGVIDPTDAEDLDRLLDEAYGRDVLYLGEIHDRYDHHVNQLQVIRGLRERGVDLAIGMEAFQAPYQHHLDDYLAGRIDETEMLRRTEYYERWRFDYRLYRDILRYARAEGIPLVALNAPSELVEAVSERGIAGLTAGQRAQLPDRIAPPSAAYERRLRQAFAMHGHLPEERLRRFMEVQSVWDEYMARRGAAYLARNREKTLVVLVGSAHVLHDSAIPQRLRRHLAVDDAVIVTAPFDPLPGVEPDYVLAARDLELERRGRTGMTLRDDRQGVTVEEVEPRSGAHKAGIQAGDRILRIGAEPVNALSDVRLALTDGTPGTRLSLLLRRDGANSPRTFTKVMTLL